MSTKLLDVDEVRSIVKEELAAVTLFEFCYRPRHRILHDLVTGTDLKSVKQRCLEFCHRHDINFVYVRPACLNLNASPRDRGGFQVDEKKEESKEVANA